MSPSVQCQIYDTVYQFGYCRCHWLWMQCQWREWPWKWIGHAVQWSEFWAGMRFLDFKLSCIASRRANISWAIRSSSYNKVKVKPWHGNEGKFALKSAGKCYFYMLNIQKVPIVGGGTPPPPTPSPRSGASRPRKSWQVWFGPLGALKCIQIHVGEIRVTILTYEKNIPLKIHRANWDCQKYSR